MGGVFDSKVFSGDTHQALEAPAEEREREEQDEAKRADRPTPA
jgi:hypothetical protein